MSNSIPLDPGYAPARRSAVGTIVTFVLAAWLLLVVTLAARHTFDAQTGTPPLALLFSFAGPLLSFFAAYRLSDAFRSFVLALDVRVMVAMHAWRFAGFGFIALYAHSILPGYFAWPAGLGDMAIALAAPQMIAALVRDPEFASSRKFVAWNLLGILDLFVAVSIGAVASIFLAGYSIVTPAPMADLPLALIPTFLVPLFLMMHFSMLLQARRRAT